MCVGYDQGGVIVLRALLGLEVFNLIGFDSAFLRQPVGATSSLLINMGGNAFSAFAAAPMMMVALAGAGLIDMLEEPPAKASPQKGADSVLEFSHDSPSTGDSDIDA